MTTLRQSIVQIVKGAPPPPPPPPPSDNYQYTQGAAFRIEWDQKTHWKQPWRSYLDTRPAIEVFNGLGINLNVATNGGAAADNVGRLLSGAGFSRARIEIGWGGIFKYDKPAEFEPSAMVPHEAKIAACKKWGLRPLVLLNANHGTPCTYKSLPITLTAEGKVGDTVIHVQPSQVAAILPGRSGFKVGGIMAYNLFTAAAEDGTVTLSQPLKTAIPVGPVSYAHLMAYGPFVSAVLADKVSPNPAFEATMFGWLDYISRVIAKVKELLGSEEFDVELWNELTFGSNFLKINNYYPSTPEPHEPWFAGATSSIYTRSVAYVKANFPSVGTGNGFDNENNGADVAPAGTAVDKHRYPGRKNWPEAEVKNEPTIIPLDALGAPQGTKDKSTGAWTPAFIPAYTSFFPEYDLCQLQTESLTYDIAPYVSYLNNNHTPTSGAHGRSALAQAYQPPSLDAGATAAGYLAAKPDKGPQYQVWMTETNMSQPEAVLPGASPADIHHNECKIISRHIVAYFNKGVDAIYYFSVSGGSLTVLGQIENSLQMVPNSFLAVGAGEYPGDEAGGVIIETVRRVMGAFAGATPIAKPGSVSLDALVGGETNVQFVGSEADPVRFPPLRNKDVFAFFPFQVDDSRRFVVPVYVMTRNLLHEYEGGSDPTRFDMPPEPFRMTIGGVKGTGSIISAVDPLSGASVPVTVISRSGTNVVVELACSDYPRLLTIQEV